MGTEILEKPCQNRILWKQFISKKNMTFKSNVSQIIKTGISINISLTQTTDNYKGLTSHLETADSEQCFSSLSSSCQLIKKLYELGSNYLQTL